jgi:hypothetical protein
MTTERATSPRFSSSNAELRRGADQHLVRPRLADRHILDDEGRSHLAQHRGLHRVSP